MRPWGIVALTAAGLLLLARTARAVAVRFKPGVVTNFAPEISRALPAIEAAHAEVGIGRGAVITSGAEGDHGAGSLHKVKVAGELVAYAVDLRDNDLSAPRRASLHAALRVRLNGAAQANRPYQIVAERTHTHIEYQPHAGWYPPHADPSQ